MRLRQVLFCIGMTLAVTAPLRADDNVHPTHATAKEKSIRVLLDLTGASRLGQQIMDQMEASLKPTNPQIPEEFWTRMRKKTKPDALVELIVPIYDKYFSQEEIDGLIAFYKSPIGQKVLTKLPAVTRESMAIGQEWGKKQAAEVIREMQAEHKH